MFRCVFVLLLLNSSYRSLGVPLPTSTSPSLDNLLAALASSCENVFLSHQIKGQLDYCSGPLTPHGGKQLECLLFYDINTQLCAAVGASKLALSGDYSAKINEEQDVNLVCAKTKDWVFSNITEFPLYINSVKKVFKHPVPCGKMCGIEDLMSDDMKYICKYFKWGTEILKTQVTVPANSPPVPETANNEDKPVNSASNDLQDVQVKLAPTSKSLNLPSEVAQVKMEETEKTEAVKPEASSENNQEPSSVIADPEIAAPKAVIEEPIAENPPAAEQSDIPLTSDSKVKSETENKAISPDTSLNKPAVDNSEKSHIETEVQKLNKEIEHKIKDQNQNPAQPKAKEPSDDDYQDSEDKDGLGDIQGDDDGDDPNVDDKIPKVEVKEDLSETQNVKTVSSDITTGERISGIYPSFGDETYADDDDDHFFSFFLTAVIMVVVIYILYHNKNKVVKVFFGLILEGRQSARRRNSRGHAYRRLDTLEQAMSTNSAAPPSKIIY